MGDEHRTRVLVVEDHAVVRVSLRHWLADVPDIEVIHDVERGEEAIKCVEEQAPDVVLLDLVLLTSHVDGLETLKRIRAASPNTQVVVLSAYADDAFVEPALCAGAIGYVLKRSDPDEVLDAIRDAVRGRHHIDPHILARLVEKMRDGSETQEPKPELTPREKEVVQLLAQGMSNAEIAYKLKIAIPTAKTHVSNILDKLGLTDRRQIPLLVAKDDPRLK